MRSRGESPVGGLGTKSPEAEELLLNLIKNYISRNEMHLLLRIVSNEYNNFDEV